MGRGKAVGEGQSTWAYARWLDCSAEQGVASTHETPLVHQLPPPPPLSCSSRRSPTWSSTRQIGCEWGGCVGM